MNNMKIPAVLLAATGAVALASSSFAQSGNAAFDIKERLILDTRLRYESVDQEFGGDAEALTARARIGYESVDYEGFKFLLEGEFSLAADKDSYDAYPGAQGPAGKALIADGETAEINRAQISYKKGDYSATIGRQRLILDNSRFFGNVGWRQNEQTFDAATFVYKPHDQYQLLYSYVDQVNRVFGSEALAGSQRHISMKTHILNGVYKPDEDNKYGFYYYDIGAEFDAGPGTSSVTYGAYYEGTTELEDGWLLKSRFEFALQRDNGGFPEGADFSENYYLGEFTGNKDDMELGAAYEKLSGDGSYAFSTPMATLHKFNGWADVFLATPTIGLVDWYVWAGYKYDKNISGKVYYHYFESDVGNIHLADEVDAEITWKVDDSTKVTAKYAYYNGNSAAPGTLKIDRDKIWLQVEYSY